LASAQRETAAFTVDQKVDIGSQPVTNADQAMWWDEDEPITAPDAVNFKTTHWSVIVRASQGQATDSAAALEKLCRSYWPPIYAFIRRKGHDVHAAQDLTQSFFAALLEKNQISVADPQRGRFRNFLLGSAAHFLANDWKHGHRLKRGGHCDFVSLNDETLAAENFTEAQDMTPEAAFDRRWAESLVAQALARLRAEMRSDAGRFDELKVFLLGAKGDVSYAATAERLGLSEAAVKSVIHRLRQRFAELVRAEVANTVASPEEAEEELRYLLSVLNG
jgi:RNA polymerase sigma-70 factor (ECF subfamily)